ncbi:hypothetical protein, partial [Aneurinibacillus tyrosinisolvens]|uniref:hypothetical protein n=1 Tax=Aneurinibacillus tyrosinisolvens TaxID=1443435 RepID=UPI00063F6294
MKTTMNTKKTMMSKFSKGLLLAGAVFLGTFGLSQTPVNAVTPTNANGLTTALPGEAFVRTLCPANYVQPDINKLIAEMRIPKKITIDGINSGNPVSLNETYLHDGCMVVYGNASYLTNGMTGKNKRGDAYRYIGYSIGSAKKVNGVDFGVNKAILYSNMAFPDDEGGGKGYLKTRKFATVKQSPKASKISKNMTEAQFENGARIFKLNRAYDKYYGNSDEPRGDFGSKNNYTKRNWEGRFLSNYADAIDPILRDEKIDKYQPLTFRMYKTTGWYSTWTTMPSVPEVCYDINETDPRKKCKGTPPPITPPPPPDFIINNNCNEWDMKMKDENGVWQVIHFGDPLIGGREVKFGVKYTTKNVTHAYPQMPVSWAWQDRVMPPGQNPNKWGWWWAKKPIGPPGGMMRVDTGIRANTWMPTNGPAVLNEQLTVPTSDLDPTVLQTGRIRLKVNINYGNGKTYTNGANTGEPNEVNFANNYSFCTFPYVPSGDAIVSMDAKKIVQEASGDAPLDGSDIDPAKYIKEDENDIDEAALNNYDYPGSEYLDNPDLAEEVAADGGIATDTNEPDFNDIAGNPSFKPDMPITIPVTVTNQLAKKISAPCVTSEAGCAPNSGTVDVSPRPGTGLPRDKMRVWLVNVTNEGDDYQLRFDPNGTVIYNRQDAAFATGQRFIEVNMPTVDPKKDFTYQFKISGLPPGKYEAYAEIPYYQNENDYKNNRAMLMFEVNEDEMLDMKCRSVYIDG